MKEFDYVIADPVGVHARPAGLLVKKASEFKSEIIISNGEKSAETKKLISLMSLGIRNGDKIHCRIEGEDEEGALLEMQNFFRENL